MPTSFESAQLTAGVTTTRTYVPLAGRAANAAGGGLLPGSSGTAVPQNGTTPATAAAPDTSAGNAPPTAAAATKVNSTFTGLCEAINTYQQGRVTAGKQKVADIYEIKFAPASMASSTIKKPGSTNFSATSLQAKDANGRSLAPETNSVNTSSRSEKIQAGTQIVQFIDKVMRNSSYISDQALYITDEVTGKQVPNANNKTGQMAWFKINVTAVPLSWDSIRNDFGYRMTYTISTYAITQMQSEYFPTSRFRGLHKVYNYWFTGQNTQILDFSQDYNNLYRWVLSGSQIKNQETTTSDPRNITRRTVMIASAQSSQGADKQANEAAANAADYLYSPGDQSSVKLKIVGDPAWLQQGEVTTGVSAKNFNFAPFNADGTINYEASEITFSIGWNQPTDYNFDTGIMNVGANNVSGTAALGVAASSGPQNTYAYVAQTVRSTFSKGKFEQELEGKLLTEEYKNLQATAALATTPPATAAPGTPNQATTTATLPAIPPTTSVNDIRASAGVDANGNFTGETASPFAVVGA